MKLSVGYKDPYTLVEAEGSPRAVMMLVHRLNIIHGTEDKATRPAGGHYFCDHAESSHKTLKLYDGHFHDLLADVDKEIVMDDILAWLDERISKETAATA